MEIKINAENTNRVGLPTHALAQLQLFIHIIDDHLHVHWFHESHSVSILLFTSPEIQKNGLVLVYDFTQVTYKTCDIKLCAKIFNLFKVWVLKWTSTSLVHSRVHLVWLNVDFQTTCVQRIRISWMNKWTNQMTKPDERIPSPKNVPKTHTDIYCIIDSAFS